MFHGGASFRNVGDALRRLSSSPAMFRVLQLNTLAHWTVDGESPDAFGLRTDLHEHHIRHVSPDVVVLEEIDGPRSLPEGQRSLPERLMHVSPSDANETSSPAVVPYQGVVGSKHISGDQTWILYNRNRFEEACPEKPHRPPVVRLGVGDEQQFAVIVVLKEKATQTLLLVVGLHAKAGRTQESEAMRIRHTHALTKALVEDPVWSAVLEAGRCILVGDFNAGPHSYGGLYPAEWYPAVVGSDDGALRGAGFVSAYATASSASEGAKKEKDGVEPEFTTYKYRKGSLISQCIDYIFFTPRGLELAAVLDLPRECDMGSTGLPAVGVWGSDHLSLACDFAMK